MTETGKEIILAVDDNEKNVRVLEAILKKDYAVKTATSGEAALEIAFSDTTPDLVLLDIMMPGMDGYEVCRRIRENFRTKNIPVIFVTALNEIDDESRGFDAGCVDYITKPVRSAIVRARVKTHLALYNQTKTLEEMVRKRTDQLNETRLEIIRRLGRAAEYKDNETGTHVIRMSRYSQLMAMAAGLGTSEGDLILNAAPMHDIGKIGIPDNILRKPGKLEPGEWDLMKKHAEFGLEIIGDHDSDILKAASIVAWTHHEKWNGSGYPRSLQGKDIHLYGRIIAIADVFDALTSRRPYKEAWPAEQAFQHIHGESGHHFDPELVPVFLELRPDIEKIRDELTD